MRAAWGVKGQQASIAKGPKREAGGYSPAVCTQLRGHGSCCAVHPMRGAPERKVSEVASLGSVLQRSLLESLSNRSGVAGNHGEAEFLGSFVMNNMEVIQPEEKGKKKWSLKRESHPPSG